MSLPFFSIVIPAYNASRFIEETLSSVLEQTFSDYEVIIVNDGSTDNTQQIIENIKDERIRLSNIPNKGVSHARNYGISQAIGKYVAFLDADDIWHPMHLQHAHTALIANPDSIWYASRFEQKEVRPTQWNINEHATPRKIAYFDAACLYVHSSTVVINRNFLLQHNPLFPENVSNAEDWIAWAKIACIEPDVLFLRETTVIYRLNILSTTKQNTEVITDKYLALTRHLRTFTGKDLSSYRNYCKWRANERWQILISRFSIANWNSLLNEHREELGICTYVILFLYFSITSTFSLLVGKYLATLNNKQERRRNQKLISK